MIKVSIFVAGLLSSTVAFADPLMDAPAYGVRAGYTLGFGGSDSHALTHSVGFSSGLMAGPAANHTLEMRWTDKGTELLVAGQLLAGKSLNAEGDWSLTDQQALYLIVAAGTLGVAAVVSNYRDSSGPASGLTGGSSQ